MSTLPLSLRREPLTTVLVHGEGQDRVVVLSVPDYGDVKRAEEIADTVAEACNAYPFLLKAVKIANDALGKIASVKAGDRIGQFHEFQGIADKAIAEIDDLGIVMRLLDPAKDKPEKE